MLASGERSQKLQKHWSVVRQIRNSKTKPLLIF